MKVRDIMTENPAFCTPDSPLQEVARLMVECDCGEIPIVEDKTAKRPIGVVTDRDITCRAVARGQNPLDLKARDVMTGPVVTVTPDKSIDECLRVMEEKRIRRVPVVDERGGCCGMVSQADIARHGPEKKVGEFVKDVSEPTGRASRTASPR